MICPHYGSKQTELGERITNRPPFPPLWAKVWHLDKSVQRETWLNERVSDCWTFKLHNLEVKQSERLLIEKSWMDLYVCWLQTLQSNLVLLFLVFISRGHLVYKRMIRCQFYVNQSKRIMLENCWHKLWSYLNKHIPVCWFLLFSSWWHISVQWAKNNRNQICFYIITMAKLSSFIYI